MSIMATEMVFNAILAETRPEALAIEPDPSPWEAHSGGCLV